MKALRNLILSTFSLLVLFTSCKKDNGDNLGGDWDLPMTQVGSEGSVYINVSGYQFPALEAVVTKNDKGLVRYKISTNPDLTGHPDSTLWVEIFDFLKKEGNFIDIDDEGNIDIGFDFFITSEGYQVISEDGKKQTIMKYNDPVGTEYTFNNVYSDQKVKGKVVEKTGLDDWPFLFYQIKTSKVEFKFPSDYPFIDKITLRGNHKFGMVFFETKFKGNQTLDADIVNWGAVE